MSMTTAKYSGNELYSLIQYLAKKIELPDLIESESGATIRWQGSKMSGVCNCPMHHHSDSNASFHVNYLEDIEKWVYHCFGCGVKGDSITFCVDYIGKENKSEAAIYLCEKYNIQNIQDVLVQSLNQVKKRVNFKHKAEGANILVSSACRNLLRSNFEKHKLWVFNSYRKMNDALENDDYELIDKIGYEVAKRMQEDFDAK